MRKKIIFYGLLALFLFTGSSPWEGAAVTAPEGELPGSGHFIATNSFPRNTVVDIVNIETNRSTRVIVANTLNSPGLLAIVSREAAELIGMRPGSVSRIRMTQPSDPIAYIRFTEGMAAGIPGFDSGNVITEENYREGLPPPRPEPVETRRPIPPPDQAESTPAQPVSDIPGYIPGPEWWGDMRSARNIVDLPGHIAPVDPGHIVEAEPVEIAESFQDEQDEYEEYEELGRIIGYFFEDLYYEEEWEEPEEIAESFLEDLYEEEWEEWEEPEEIAEHLPEDEIVESVTEVAELPNLIMVSTEERPPLGSIYGIDPADIIPGISMATVEYSSDEPMPVIVIVSAPTPTLTPAPAPVTIPVPAPVPVVSDMVFLEPVVTEPVFSIPRIYELNRGSYYVQVAAFDEPNLVENAISGIEHYYKPVVYKDGDHWYRVLLGPLNQGESAAILQRFRSIGYRDAFVRHVR